jgi:hypothetical protein
VIDLQDQWLSIPLRLLSADLATILASRLAQRASNELAPDSSSTAVPQNKHLLPGKPGRSPDMVRPTVGSVAHEVARVDLVRREPSLDMCVHAT